jgi:exodeoxyribonuclease-3
VGRDRASTTSSWAAAAARCTGARIDRAERKGKQPSDHAPVVVELDV